MPKPDAEREPLDRDRILAAGIDLADEHGVDALSMRKLARHLGYEVMSLYNHVQNKTDLLDGMVDHVAGEIDAPAPDLGWRAAVRQIAVSAHEALLRHPWAASLWSSSWPGPNRWHHMETMLAALAAADFHDDLADLGFHAITLHITGFTQQQITYRDQAAGSGGDEMMQRFHAEVDASVYPRIHEHVRYHELRDAGRDEPHDEFGFVLDLILDGLEQTRAAGSAAATTTPITTDR